MDGQAYSVDLVPAPLIYDGLDMCYECNGPQFQILDLLSVFLALGCYLPLFVGIEG